MNDFRGVKPKRRNNPKEVSKYGQHKNDLCEDFESCCGYCGDHHLFSGGMKNYQIDHFVPKSLKLIDEKKYSNLVYSCFYCNNRKRKDWPTGKVDVPNDGTKGYIDPCDEKYPKQFQRNDIGEIVPCSSLGEYMHLHLNLGLRRHALIWYLTCLNQNIEHLRSLVDENLLDKTNLDYISALEEFHYAMMNLNR